MEQYPSVKAPKKRTNKAGKVRWLARYRDLEAGKVVERSVGTYDTKKEAVDQTRKAIDELNVTINAQLDIPEINVPDPSSERLAIRLGGSGAVRHLKRLCLRTVGDVLTEIQSDKQYDW